MPSGGLLRNLHLLVDGDVELQRKLMVQVSIFALLLLLSAFYHFVLRNGGSSSQLLPKGSRDDDVAEVDSIIVYPIKSCHGITLDSVEVSRKGFQYDRRWLIVAKEGLKWLSLREDPKLTFIIPSFEMGRGEKVMRLRYSKVSGKDLPDIEVPLEPDEETTSRWDLLPDLNFYGSSARGRIVEADQRTGGWKGSPSEWVSEALGYPVYLLYFDKAASKRQPFPIYKPPFDMNKWDVARKEELMQDTGIEFQDEYPFLVSSRESLDGLNMQLEDAIGSSDPPTKIDKEHWSSTQKRGGSEERGIKMQSFRPNIVLRSRAGMTAFPAFSEDSWETIWIANESGTLPIHLVARCKRCLLTAVDPETAHKDINVPLGLLRKSRFRVKKAEGESGRKGPCFGMYGIPEKSTIDSSEKAAAYPSIAVGDAVRVRWRPLHLDDEVEAGSRRD